eukprot:TRINITY_DN11906_c0_g1_i1.p3 TRINITY_DN11906_c0_g1~~TRINITY_DN11906_c0_g1_i1.p3  ORF type:complete len:62 (+),score=9.76 TRINITY_DN11906_c0_g1_i1:344-529(+)
MFEFVFDVLIFLFGWCGLCSLVPFVGLWMFYYVFKLPPAGAHRRSKHWAGKTFGHSFWNRT